MEIQVQKITGDEEMAVAYAIRERVFSAEQRIPEELDRDGHDDRAFHVIVRVNGHYAATGRLLPETGGIGHLARIAVLPDYRGLGLGKRIMAALETHARHLRLRRLELDAHEFLQPYYERLGYQLLPEDISVAGYRLIKMAKDLHG